jgi:AcrR family transcriptional regulator
VGKKRGPYSSPLQQERRQRILRAARSELEKHGVAALTMKGIAEASDVSLKTLYNLFGNRELLLLLVASEQLDELEKNTLARDIEPGIPQLLAYAEGAMQLFSAAPDLAAVTVRILLQADNDLQPAHVQLERVRKFAHEALCYAAERGEFLSDFDLDELSILISGQQWGLALMWDKGLLSLDQLQTQLTISHCLTLSPLCRGERKRWLEARVRELLTHSRPVTATMA